MDQDLFEQLAQRIDALVADRNRLKAEVERLQAEGGAKNQELELELEQVCIFLVHLSLKFRHRQYQLRFLHDLIKDSRKPVIVAGDFNVFWGTHEIYLFMQASGLRSANELNVPSNPARAPRVELDFILVSPGIDVRNFRVPDVRHSDHRPVICDFEVRP